MQQSKQLKFNKQDMVFPFPVTTIFCFQSKTGLTVLQSNLAAAERETMNKVR